MQRMGKFATGAVAALALFGVGFAVGSSTGDSNNSATDPPATVASTNPTTDPPATSPTTSETSIQVAADDIAIEYIVLDESCFNTAGSTMEIEMSPGLAPNSNLSVDDFSELRLLVTFDITNTEGGTTRGSFEIDRGRFAPKTDRLSFPQCNTSPNIVVTGVIER